MYFGTRRRRGTSARTRRARTGCPPDTAVAGHAALSSVDGRHHRTHCTHRLHRQLHRSCSRRWRPSRQQAPIPHPTGLSKHAALQIIPTIDSHQGSPAAPGLRLFCVGLRARIQRVRRSITHPGHGHHDQPGEQAVRAGRAALQVGRHQYRKKDTVGRSPARSPPPCGPRAGASRPAPPPAQPGLQARQAAVFGLGLGHLTHPRMDGSPGRAGVPAARSASEAKLITTWWSPPRASGQQVGRQNPCWRIWPGTSRGPAPRRPPPWPGRARRRAMRVTWPGRPTSGRLAVEPRNGGWTPCWCVWANLAHRACKNKESPPRHR